jgi:hypothetical protein
VQAARIHVPLLLQEDGAGFPQRELWFVRRGLAGVQVARPGAEIDELRRECLEFCPPPAVKARNERARKSQLDAHSRVLFDAL